MEIDKALELDLYHLDDAWLDLPRLTEEWNNKAVEADIAAMNAKNDLDAMKSYLDQDIRENPTNYGIAKITEGTVVAAINSHNNVVKLSDTYYECLSYHKRMKSACASIATKEKALQGLTKLYEAGYFASKPICATVSTIKQEKETSKLNTPENKDRLRKALKK